MWFCCILSSLYVWIMTHNIYWVIVFHNYIYLYVYQIYCDLRSSYIYIYINDQYMYVYYLFRLAWHYLFWPITSVFTPDLLRACSCICVLLYWVQRWVVSHDHRNIQAIRRQFHSEIIIMLAVLFHRILSPMFWLVHTCTCITTIFHRILSPMFWLVHTCITTNHSCVQI